MLSLLAQVKVMLVQVEVMAACDAAVVAMLTNKQIHVGAASCAYV